MNDANRLTDIETAAKELCRHNGRPEAEWPGHAETARIVLDAIEVAARKERDYAIELLRKAFWATQGRSWSEPLYTPALQEACSRYGFDPG